jgi:acetolactate synthase-1/3 small subunit
MTIVVEAEDERILEQIIKQLHKLIDVISVTDFTKREHVDRELILVKVHVAAKDKARIRRLLTKIVGKIVLHKGSEAVIEAVGDQKQIRELLLALEPFGVKELIRTGRIAMAH